MRKRFQLPPAMAAELTSTRKWLYRRAVAKPLGMARKYALMALPFTLPKTNPAESDGYQDIFIWGVIDWHFRFQRPQQLAKAFAARGYRVFYISSNFRNDRRAGFDIEPLDASGHIFQVKLFLNNPPIIYFTVPSAELVQQLRHSVGELLCWSASRGVISLIQHPFWFDTARAIPNGTMIYDCIDHHEGFGNNSVEVIAAEDGLFRHADAVVSTSEWLYRHSSTKDSRHRTIVRNGCDFAHFSTAPSKIYAGRGYRKIIGYYGAIANWLDVDLMRSVAARFPDCEILMIGADTVRAQVELSDLANLTFTGEVPYDELPHYLHAFDVALLPFKIVPLTLATNPVKVYEYLSAGKRVVAVDLPEMEHYDSLVGIAKSAEHFLDLIEQGLDETCGEDVAARRKEFAAKQTWQHRADEFLAFVASEQIWPKISVVVVTYNNLELTKACLGSIDNHSDYNNLEVIVVDNASNDGSKAFLKEWQRRGPNRIFIDNEDNRGFSAANNQGLAVATGEYFVLLNNDTYVTPGWLRTLLNHLRRNRQLGLVGPVTNNIGNEAKIDIAYKSMDEMLRRSTRFVTRHAGSLMKLRTLAFFCVMLPRDVHAKIGPLDETFGLGFFEDDDYCRRLEAAGFDIACAQDVFIHHHLSASFMKLDGDVRRNLFAENKRRYEAKWGTWQPHQTLKRK